MKKLLKRLAVLFAVILAMSVFAFATESEEEKTYIVYPKKEVALFSARGETPEYMVISEEELNMLLEESPEMIDWYEENIKGELFDTDTVPYDPVYLEKTIIDDTVYEGYVKYELQVVNAADVWENGYYGNEIRVAVIDSGIDTDHPEFDGKILDGEDYTTKEDSTEEHSIEDTFSHGTCVSGMIVAAHNGLWIKGIAPNVKIVPLKVTNNGVVYSAQVSRAIRDAVDIYECDVINLSLGFPSNNDTLKNAVDYAVGKGVAVVAAVGNYKNVNEDTSYVDYEFMEESEIEIAKDDNLQYPAAYDNVIGVGSVHRLYGLHERAERISPISRRNTSVLITAPGERVITTTLGEKNYITYSYGTSLSAPLVTGAVALLKQANPDLTPAEIMSILAESATDDAKGDGYDTAYGHGILNVAAAIELVLDENRAPSTVTYRVTADDELLSSAVTVANYAVGNIGSHPLGESFTAKAKTTYKLEDGTEYKFAYWANGNGTHVSGDETYTFTATSNFTLRAVYDKVSAGEGEAPAEKTVEFWNGNGVLLGTQNVNAEGKISTANIPEADAKMTGYTFAGWLDDEKNEFSADSVLEKNLTRVVAQFKDTTEQYSITFDDIADTTKNGVYGEKVTYSAKNIGFDYWEINGKIVSYDPSIEIALWGADKKLTAVYDDDDAVAKPTVVLDEGADEADFLIYSVPDNYKIIDAGIVFGKENEKPRVASFRSKASVKKLPEDGFGQFTSLPGNPSHEVARGYLIFKDPDDVIRVIYSD